MPDSNRLFHPEQAIDLATNTLNHMRLQQVDELAAVNASLNVLLEAAAWLLVRSSKSEAVAAHALTFADHFQELVAKLNTPANRGGTDEPDLPPAGEPAYAGIDPNEKITHQELEGLCLAIAPSLNEELNRPYGRARLGFVVSIFEYGPPGSPLAFVSSANGDDAKAALTEVVQRMDAVGKVTTAPRPQ